MNLCNTKIFKNIEKKFSSKKYHDKLDAPSSSKNPPRLPPNTMLPGGSTLSCISESFRKCNSTSNSLIHETKACKLDQWVMYCLVLLNNNLPHSWNSPWLKLVMLSFSRAVGFFSIHSSRFSTIIKSKK